MKKILILLGLTICIGIAAYYWFSRSISIDWGHHFTFQNELGIPIDSLNILVGNIATNVKSILDDDKHLEGNIIVPDQEYPHKVVLTLYSGLEVITLKADSFNCYNCDGNHLYILLDNGAKYQFLN